MRVNRYHMMILLLAWCSSCIDPYDPQVEENRKILVINGFISDQSGPHQVVVTQSTPYSNPSFDPVSGCVVAVEDETGMMVAYAETTPGVYESDLESDFLGVGKSYSLFVSTPDGNEYRSDFDSLLACPPVDDIYYEVEQEGTTNPDITHNGVQFYVDVMGTPEATSNYRWLMEETWEYTAPYIADHIWFGKEVLPYDSDSTYQCSITTLVKGIFSASTRYLSVNHLNRHPLHYVSDETPRLKIRYSVLVKQQSLSNPAYDYWDRMELQEGEGSGLYESQPSSSAGNIYNVHDPSERVLGYFYASQIQERRITFENHFEFEIEGYKCTLDTIQNLSELDNEFPHYFIYLDSLNQVPRYLYGSKKCFDCRYWGGDITPPDY